MPQMLASIRQWVHEADGDDLQLLLQALDVRVAVPMIEGADFVTIERISV